MVGMKRHIFSLAGLLVLGSAGCAVVGYPAPVRAPVTVAATPSRGSPPPPGGVMLAAAPIRTYEVFGRSYTTLPIAVGFREIGVASWYGEPFHGRPTASGERFDMYALTAAHRALPLPTCVAVRRLDDGRQVTVRVNDRGPFSDDARRIIDLSFSAAQTLGLVKRGTAEVEVRALDGDVDC